MKTMTGAQIVIESLLAEGVDTIFGYPGGAILPTYDALMQIRPYAISSCAMSRARHIWRKDMRACPVVLVFVL